MIRHTSSCPWIKNSSSLWVAEILLNLHAFLIFAAYKQSLSKHALSHTLSGQLVHNIFENEERSYKLMSRDGLTLWTFTLTAQYTRNSNHYMKLKGTSSFSAPANHIIGFNIEVFPYNDNRWSLYNICKTLWSLSKKISWRQNIVIFNYWIVNIALLYCFKITNLKLNCFL